MSRKPYLPSAPLSARLKSESLSSSDLTAKSKYF